MIKLLSIVIFAGLIFEITQGQPGRIRLRVGPPRILKCWTRWFDRDNPSGIGDFEILADLHRQYPGRICSNPLEIQVTTRRGLCASWTGDVFYKKDTSVGFICRNRDQPRGRRCHDYRVRFRCPAAFCRGCWTPWSDRDNPSGTGDWETLYNLHREYPGKICSNPVAIEARVLTGHSAAAVGNVIFKTDATVGFVCRNKDQPRGRRCRDYRVRFRCPRDFCNGCWTQYYDRDDPSVTGDWETLSNLRKENPGKICPKPLGIEARTLAGLSPAAAGNAIYKIDTITGFVCRNKDQPKGKLCSDFKVRFRCPPAYCKGCWTKWLDRDNPSGTGDWETLFNFHREKPGQICSNPVAIQVSPRFGLSPAGNVIFQSDTTVGFICLNKDQPRGRRCLDYRVRFRCPTDFCEGCWTDYFDRDNPSGTGDWEILANLRKENPGKICPNPTAIDVKTLAGLTPAQTRENIYRIDTASGFVCRNADQPSGKKCSDYKVRFRCPADFCKGPGCYTPYFDRDNPSGKGDFETLFDFHKERPGQICSNPTGIQALTLTGQTVSAAGDTISKSDTTVGFICLNKDQPGNKQCKDYKVRFRCPTDFCEGCWTGFFDRDNPSGTGDWETTADLRKENPGKICSNPTAIEVRTLAGLTPAQTGEKIFKIDTISGFVCRNADQPSGKKCSDYKVRFRCPADFCKGPGCYTPYFDRDNPSGKGDFETLFDFHKERPGQICSNPTGIQALTLTGQTVSAAGDTISKSDTTVGFICLNKDQPGNKQCKDYKVRFRCPTDFCEGCWTDYFDRDNPSGTGDWEILANLRKENPGKICPNPTAIDVKTLAGLTPAQTRENIYRIDTASGFVCRNADQPSGKKCSDYKVRFRCPADFCKGPGCYTPYFDRDNPSGKGDFETLFDFHKERPGQICSNPTGIQALTLTGQTVSAAGDTISKSDTTVGFICLNKDQPGNKQCKDYKVRFRCPTDFCEGCWTGFFDRDNPSGTGDWETTADLRKENPGKICSNPTAIEVRTLAGLTPAQTGEKIFKIDTISGFVCRNADQPSGKKCSDYKVRFRCPADFCKGPGCYTPYFDRDNPSGKGDFETLFDFHKERPGQICSNPTGIQALTLTGQTVSAAGDTISKSDTTVGFICLNKDQPGNKQCKDYKVRFRCPTDFCEGCWTDYFDRDNPSGTGDWEILANLRKENPGKICPNPTAIDVKTLAGLTPAQTRENIYRIDTASGFVCRNADQPSGKKCSDYKVRFRCPADFCKGPGCYTPYFDRDNPSGKGDFETLFDFHKERPGQICSNPTGIQALTLTGQTVSAAGDTISKSDTTVGFICLNKDQPGNKQCKDYKVRFRCPTDFCEGCWTGFFDRDNPSGTGDWETTADLRKENPGKICSNPTAIEVRTLAGLTPAQTGEKIFKIDTISGFVCRNADQPSGKKCSDYKVRFRCPADFCKGPGCYTPYFDRDNPSGKGDFETLFDFHKERPGQICSNPTGIQALTLTGQTVSAAGDTISKSDTTVGFICLNKDQPGNKQCKDYKVRFRCPTDFCEGCWTGFFDRDNPSGTGDWETTADLRKENPGKICSNPTAIEVRTLAGLTPAQTGEKIFKIDTISGFVCRNADQPSGKKCSDYKVRFRCPADFCKGPGCYTPYFDRDNPSGKGDFETLFDFHKERPGQICSNPTGIQALTLTGQTVSAAGDTISKSDTTVGFICLNKDQPGNKQCKDYKVRFRCPTDFCEGCWTGFFDRDNPSGTGDWETTADLRKENPGKICSNPTAIEVRTLAGLTPAQTGEKIFKIDTISGFVCRNADQPSGKKCSDYKVRFRCPADFCKGPGCYTPYFDRDNPSGKGDFETLFDFHKERPGQICSNPTGIQALTLTGQTVSAAGDTISKSDTTVGFICLNKDQPGNKQCKDYKVRFRCPTDFCEGCWTGFFDRDNPSGTGDWETTADLRKENPGKICSNPTAIEVRTLAGLTPAQTGEKIFKIDTISGFVCRNADQPSGKKCSDYKVRFRCPADFCKGCYTPYFDRDNPSGKGDFETLFDFHKERPGQICSNPTGIQALTLTGQTVSAAGDTISKSDTTVGFICLNKDQPGNKQCKDYKVRFRCPTDFCEGCWTRFFDRDNPSGTGDWETTADLRKENPGKICPNPTAIEVRTLAGLTVAQTGEKIFKIDTASGFVCRNADQPSGKKCSDYKVRFRCPAGFC